MNEAHRAAKRRRHLDRIEARITAMENEIAMAKSNPAFADKALIAEKRNELRRLNRSLENLTMAVA